MAKSIYELINSKALSSYYTELESNRIPFLGEALFPDKKKMGLKLEWIKGFNSLPIALMPSAFDAKPTIRGRLGISDISTRMPFFRESMRIGEEDRQQLLMFQEQNNNPYATEVVNRIFDDATNLVKGALVQGERMRMSVLIDGKIAIEAPDDSGVVVNYDYDFDPTGAWRATNNLELLTTSKWDAPTTSNPIADIITAKKYMAVHYGVTITRGIMTTTTWNLFAANDSIRKDMNVTNGDKLILTDMDLNRYLSLKTGISFVIYDKMYKDETGADKQFYPDNYVTLLPGNTLGQTWYGTTPEEADLMSGNTDADVTIVNTGIAVLTKKESLPVNIITSVSEIVLPSFERMADVYTIKVA
jgi:hypothetical protein